MKRKNSLKGKGNILFTACLKISIFFNQKQVARACSSVLRTGSYRDLKEYNKSVLDYEASLKLEEILQANTERPLFPNFIYKQKIS
ncbi:MAG: hypothetical protein AAF518_00965 [Spirochaetota bacterium]